MFYSYPTQCNLTEHIVYIYYDMNLLSVSVHNSHQFCARVAPPEDGQVMPETWRDIEHQKSVVKRSVHPVGCALT
jgi:hypothetical protein